MGVALFFFKIVNSINNFKNFGSTSSLKISKLIDFKKLFFKKFLLAGHKRVPPYFFVGQDHSQDHNTATRRGTLADTTRYARAASSQAHFQKVARYRRFRYYTYTTRIRVANHCSRLQ